MPGFKFPSWLENISFYEIYPQTFYDSNADGIGDILGIISKLDYIKQLGFEGIWLNPCYVSPFRDAGYDVADYYKVAPRYGSNDDLKKLFQEAKNLDIKVILDLVPGHTSIDHPWFKESAKYEKNKYSNWYIWTNSTWDKGGKWAKNMVHGFGERDGNYLINFFWSQPALNFGFAQPDPECPWQLPCDHPDILPLREEFKNIIRFWLKMGAAGFRVDMAGSLIREDKDRKEIMRFWQEVRQMMDQDFPGSFLVSEWSVPHLAVNGGFHADFLHWIPSYENLFRSELPFFSKKVGGDISAFIADYQEAFSKIKSEGCISIPVGNHDLSRVNNGRDEKELEIIFAFLFFMPGIPFFYYGDELPMRQLGHTPNKEGHYPPRAGARTPMQWSLGKNLGFSEADQDKLYLPVDPSDKAPNVEEALQDSQSFLHKIKHFVAIKKQEKALSALADFKALFCEKGQSPFVFLREKDNQKILVALNPVEKEKSINIKIDKCGKNAALLCGDDNKRQFKDHGLKIDMAPVSYTVLKFED